MIGYREEQVLEKLDQIIALLGELNLAGQGKGERKAGSQRPKYTRDMDLKEFVAQGLQTTCMSYHSKNGTMPQITLEEAITKAQHDDYFMNNYGNWKRDESTEDSRPTIYLQGGPNIVNLKFGTIGAFKKQGYNK